MKFSDIPGQKEIIDKLISSVNEGRVSHAQLFAGPEGCGSLALAVAYAQYISCENRGEADSCGVCKSCEKYNKLIHPDFHFVFPVIKTKKFDEPVSDNFIAQWREFFNKSPYCSQNDWMNALEVGNSQGQIAVYEASEILRKHSLKSYESDFKIMVIWLPEKMHPAAANKLLKLIEEPPAKTIFLLVSNEPEKVLPTILSRCQLIKIPAFTEKNLAFYLESRHKIPSDKAAEMSHISNGNINRAIELATTSGGTTDQNLNWFTTIMRAAYSRKIIEVMDWAEELAAAGRENQKDFLGYALRMLRENLMLTMVKENNNLVYLSHDESVFSSKFHSFINENNVYALTKEFNLAYSHVEANGSAKIIFLDLGLRIVKLIRQ